MWLFCIVFFVYLFIRFSVHISLSCVVLHVHVSLFRYFSEYLSLSIFSQCVSLLSDAFSVCVIILYCFLSVCVTAWYCLLCECVTAVYCFLGMCHFWVFFYLCMCHWCKVILLCMSYAVYKFRSYKFLFVYLLFRAYVCCGLYLCICCICVSIWVRVAAWVCVEFLCDSAMVLCVYRYIVVKCFVLCAAILCV